MVILTVDFGGEFFLWFLFSSCHSQSLSIRCDAMSHRRDISIDHKDQNGSADLSSLAHPQSSLRPVLPPSLMAHLHQYTIPFDQA